MSLKFYGPHGMAKETLASGALIPEGDFFEMERDDLKEPHNIRLIREGKVLPSSKTAVKAAEEAVENEEQYIQLYNAREMEPQTVPEGGGESAENNEGGEGGEA